jgi:RNA-binding protein
VWTPDEDSHEEEKMNNDIFRDSIQDLRPTVWIGKQGCTETIVEEIAQQLEKKRVIKVKWLHNTEVDPEDLAKKAGAELAGVRGRTMILVKKRKK